MMKAWLESAARFGLSGRVAAVVLLLYLVGTAFEGAALGMLLPVFQFVQSGGDVAMLAAQGRLWTVLLKAHDALGIPVSLASLLAASFAALLLRQAIYYLRTAYTARAREWVTYEVRVRGLARYLAAETAHQESLLRGELVNDLTTDLNRAVQCMFYTLTFFGLCILGAVYLVGLFVVSWPMTLIALATIGAAFLLARGLFRRSASAGERVAVANRDMSGFLVQRLSSARLVRLSGAEAAERERMAALAGRQRDLLYRLELIGARVNVFVEPFVIGAILILLYVSVTAFGLELGAVGLFLLVILRLLPVTKELANLRNTVLAFRGSLESVVRRLDELESAAEPKGGTRRFERLCQAIRFEAVRFRYPGRESYALDGISLEIPARKMTALVGPSGAGKSTLIDLIPRLRVPETGRVLIDGVPIEEFELSSLRAGIAYAPQTPQFFDESVAEHIRYGRPATEADIREAARLAGALDFIAQLPQGYDTPVGEGGARLSGGQRQRLDLARALARRAPILILDEPTSQLDAEAEAAFRDALRRIRRETDITLVVIAHRLSTVAAADRIVVMQNGRVAAVGSHAELLARGGWYAEAFALSQAGPAAPEASVAGGR